MFTYICKEFKNGLKWFCENTNFNGFNHIVNPTISIVARLFFSVATCSSFCLCVYLIILQVFDYYNAYIVTRIVDTSYPVWLLRFPSVIICSTNIIYRSNFEILKDTILPNGKIKEEIFDEFANNLPLLLEHDLFKNHTNDYQQIYDLLGSKGYNVDRLMKELSHPCMTMINKCFWQGKETACSEIIYSVKTNLGYCCAFNYYGMQDILETMNDPYNLKYTYSTLSDPVFGLKLFLDAEKDQYVSGIKSYHGFNVLIEDGANYPDMHLSSTTLLASEELRISVTPQVYTSTKDLKSMKPDHRECVFEDEINLEWSPIYSYQTCISHCKAKAILKFCHCIPFYYPLENVARECTLLDLPCLQAYKHNYMSILVDGVVRISKEALDINPDFKEYFKCTCLPQCNERLYYTHRNKVKLMQLKENSWDANLNLSILHVYYSDQDCIKLERDIYYTWERMLASIGGIFSLCLGGSLISIAECFYFFIKSLWKLGASIIEKTEISSVAPQIMNKKVKKKHKKKKFKYSKTKMFLKAFGNS